MPRYIDIDKMNRWTEVDQESCSRENCASCDYDCNECYYNNGGAEYVAPVVHAKWEWSYDKDGYVCSNCGQECAGTRFEGASFLTPYCPFCSAKMDKE